MLLIVTRRSLSVLPSCSTQPRSFVSNIAALVGAADQLFDGRVGKQCLAPVLLPRTIEMGEARVSIRLRLLDVHRAL